ncbi:MAG: response regulator [Bacteroidetes bacterium]|nr:response regulator [Bacteroidota bacterium]MBU1578034.1 response regulator [Bacteroidota bacterium]
MKTITLFFFLSLLNGLFSNTLYGELPPMPQQEKGTEEESRIPYEEGLSWFKMAEFHAAEKAFLEAISIAENTGEKEMLAFSLHYLGNIDSWKANFHQSIFYHKKAKALFSEIDNFEYVGISNRKIAIGFENLGNYDSTLAYYKLNIANREVFNRESISKKTLGNSKKESTLGDTPMLDVIFTSYQAISALYAKLQNYREAYTYLREAIEYAEETESKAALAKLYFTAGQLFLNNHVNKDIALEYMQEAQMLFRELNDLQYLNWARLSVGDWHLKTGDDSLALRIYKEVSLELDSGNHSTQSQTDYRIGMTYKKRNNYDSALVYLQKSIDGMCMVCPEIQIHKSLIEAGLTYLIIDDSPQAFAYLNRSRKIADESQSGMEMVKSSEALAKYYLSIQKQDSAIYFLKDAYKLAGELGLIKSIKSAAEQLSDIYYSSGEFQTSSDFLAIANQMNDSLAGIEKYNEVAKLEMRFEIEKREEERKMEARLFESEIAKQKLIRNTSMAGAIIVIIIGIMLLRAYRSKRKDNKLLASQKAEIQEISIKLQESSKRKLDFFTNISHEIRTPLTLIKSPLERILKADKKGPETDGQLQIALNNTNKLKELLNQILDLQKLDEKMLGLDLTNFELIAFCREIVASFEGYSYQSNCGFKFESNIGEALVRFDQIRLRSIITNLLSNAFKYNKQGGWVQFKIEVTVNQLKLEIKDTGIGISAEHLNKLGERYYQVEKPNASVEGTGIGLAYVKELVELMKGELEILSALNEGTAVTISLPCNDIDILKETPLNKEIKPKEQLFDQLEEQLSDNSNGLSSILIVEDNNELRKFLHDLFASDYQVITAKDGLEGKEMALKHVPDLIISDIMMPGIDGNELCRALKNDINTSHITIILFTAKGSPESIVDGYDCGADDYIVKPFDTDILLKKVKNMIATAVNARRQFSFTDIERSTTKYSEFDKKFLKGCLSIVKDNLDNSQFTVEILAENMSVHRRTLLRKFNALTDKTPADLIRHTRMTKAAELLKDKKYRVNEVALMVGYEDTNRFSQAFKQYHGVSPSGYK